MEVYVVRHTRVTTAPDTCYGQLDIAVAETFAEEAAKLKSSLPLNFDAIFCSPLQRCQTLGLAFDYPAQNIPAPALMEMNFGEWEGQKWNDIDQAKLHHWMQNFVTVRTPNGESLSDLFDRVQRFLDKLRTRQIKRALLITHAGVIRCIWAYLLAIPLERTFRIPVEYGEVFAFRLATDDQLDVILKK
jgi:alpha-ribazole phosphatase